MLTGEHKVRVFEFIVLRGVFGCKMEEVERELREVHVEEVCYLCSVPYTFRMIKSKADVVCMSGMKNEHKIIVRITN
jgi:hypothetical protein